MEQQPQQQRLTLTERLAQWGREELDAFYRDVDIVEPQLPVRHQEAHWLCRAPEMQLKSKRTGEMTPMYRLGRSYYSRQRIALILELHQDPEKKSRIRTQCGVEECINPYHLRVVAKKRNKQS